MKFVKSLVLAMAALAAALPAAAQPDRLNDKDVKALIEQSKKSFEKFWEKLDSDVKDATYTGPRGQFAPRQMKDDYGNAIDAAEKRFSDSYSSSTEVGTVLQKAALLNDLVGSKGPGVKGVAEWQVHAEILHRLAKEYGTTFPPAGQAVRRYTDSEVEQAAAKVYEGSKDLASALDKALKQDKATPDATRKSMVESAKKLGDLAKPLRSAVADDKPSSAQATALLDHGARLRNAVSASAAASAWNVVAGPMGLIAAAFHQSW
jgi:hypothetical protein